MVSTRLNHSSDRADDARELCELDLQLLPTLRREVVVPCATIVAGGTPLPGHPAFDQHPLKSRIQRPFFDREHLIRFALDRFGDFEAMHLAAPCERLENQHVQGSLRDDIARHDIDILCQGQRPGTTGREAGGWRLEVGGWRLDAEGWRLKAGGWRLEAGGCR